MKTGLESSDLKYRAISIARALVRKHGYEKFRLNDVAKEMGVTHAALYKYFDGKDELLDAVNMEWLDQIDNTLSNIAVDATLTPREQIKAWFMQLYLMKREKVLADIEPYSALIMASEQKKPFIKKHLENQFKQVYSMVQMAFPNRDANIATNQLMEATMLYHHPQLVKNDIEKDKASELMSLLDVLTEGLAT